MEKYEVTYKIVKKKNNYEWTRSIDERWPEVLWPTFALINQSLEKTVLNRAKEIGKSFELKVIFQLPD